MLQFHNKLYKFWISARVFEKYVIKTNLQNKMQITYFLMASKNIDFDHECHVIVYR